MIAKLFLTISIFATLFFSSIAVAAKSYTLNMMAWQGYAPDTLIQAYKRQVKKKHGIELIINVTIVNEIEELYNQLRTKRVDLVTMTHNTPKSTRWNYIKNKLLLPINLANLTHYSDLNDGLKHLSSLTENDKVYGIPFAYGPYGLAYNPSKVTKEPTSWNVLWDKKYQRDYTLSSDYYEANIYITALSMGYKVPDIYNFELLNQNNELKEKLSVLAQRAKSFWVGVDDVDTLQRTALSGAWGFSLPELARRGEHWKFAQPIEGTPGWVDNWSIGYSLKDKPLLKKLAEEWIDFTISPGAQAYYVYSIGVFPSNPQVANSLSPKLIERFKLNEPDYFKDSFILFGQLSRRQQAGFKRMWEAALLKK